MQLIPTAPNRQAEQIGAGLAAFGRNTFAVRQYQDELKAAQDRLAKEDEERALRMEDRALRLEDRQRALDERSAEQAYNAQAVGKYVDPNMQQADAAQRVIGSFPMRAVFGKRGQEFAARTVEDFTRRKTFEADRIKRAIAGMSPEAGRRVLSDFQEMSAAEEEAVRRSLIKNSIVELRRKARYSSGMTGADVSEIYNSLSPELVDMASPSELNMLLAAAEDAEKAITAQIEQHKEDVKVQGRVTRAQGFMQPKLNVLQEAANQGMVGQEMVDDLSAEMAGILAEAGSYTAPGFQNALDEWGSRAKIGSGGGADSKRRTDLIDEWTRRGIPYEGRDDSDQPTVLYRRPKNIAEVEQAVDDFLGRARPGEPPPFQNGALFDQGSPFRMSVGGQANGAPAPAAPTQAPTARREQPDPRSAVSATAAPRQQEAEPGLDQTAQAARSRLEKPVVAREKYVAEKAPEKMHREVAELAVRGIPAQQAAAMLGLDLATLTAEDQKAIKTLVAQLRKERGERDR